MISHTVHYFMNFHCNKLGNVRTYLVYSFDRRKRNDANFPHGYRKLQMPFFTVTIYVFHIRRHYWEINTFLSVNAVFDLWDMRIDWIQLTSRLFMCSRENCTKRVFLYQSKQVSDICIPCLNTIVRLQNLWLVNTGIFILWLVNTGIFDVWFADEAMSI